MHSIRRLFSIATLGFMLGATATQAQLAFSQTFTIQQPAGVYYIFEAVGLASAPSFAYINYNNGEYDQIVPQGQSDGSFVGSSANTGRGLSGKISGNSVNLTYNGVAVGGSAISEFGFAKPIAGHYNGIIGGLSSGIVVFPNGFAEYIGTSNQSGVGSVDNNGFVTFTLLNGEIFSFRLSPANGLATGTAQSSFYGAQSYLFTKTDIQRLVNISTRAFVQGGSHTLIGGFIVQDGVKAVLLRGIGPSLTAAGVPDALQNPRIDVYQGQTLVASNADWKTNTNAAEIQASGIAPSDQREAALLITLKPGNYTAQVSSEDAGQGVALVEVYDIK